MATSSVAEFALSDPLITLVASLASCVDVADRHSLTTSGAKTVAEQIREEVQRDAESIRPIANKVLPGVNSIKGVQSVAIAHGRIALRDVVDRNVSHNTACIIIPIVVRGSNTYLKFLDGTSGERRAAKVGAAFIVASKGVMEVENGEMVCAILGIRKLE